MSADPFERRYALDPPPLIRGADTYRTAVTVTVVALLPILATCGALFGLAGIGTILGAVFGAWVGEALAARLLGRGDPTGSRHAVLIGLLLACTLPPDAPWRVAVTAGLIAAAFGKAMAGGLGHYTWHPALIGRVLVEWLYPAAGTVASASGERLYPVLSIRHLFWGDLAAHVQPPAALGWLKVDVGTAEALLRRNPVEQLRALADGLDLGAPSAMIALLRDRLPPIEDCFIGAVGGGLGATPTVAIILGGLLLIHRRIIPWQLPAAVLLAFALAIAVLPIRESGSGELDWFPGLISQAGDPVPLGLLYVCYHLACGSVMLVAFFLAGDWICSPMSVRGQVVYGMVIGFSAAALRLYGVPPYDYWAVLIGNTTVPLIDRITARRVMGT